MICCLTSYFLLLTSYLNLNFNLFLHCVIGRMLVSFGHSLSLAKTQRRKERRMFFLDCVSGRMLVIFGHPLSLAKTQGRNFIWITDTLPNLSTRHDLHSYFLLLTSYLNLNLSLNLNHNLNLKDQGVDFVANTDGFITMQIFLFFLPEA